MPLPKPRDNESQDDFLERCIPEAMSGDLDNDQAVAACYTQWRDRNKDTKDIPERSFDQHKIDRAYSVITIKGIDEDRRIIEGIATTPSTDRAGDIVESLGAQYTIPISLLWQHKHDEPVGWVEFAQPRKDGISIRARITNIDDPGSLKDRIDNAWQSLKFGLVRGLSIGFKPLQLDRIKGGGIHFKAWKWLELSLVTVPMNEEATIHAVKSYDAELLAALGRGQLSTVKPPGASGMSHSVLLKADITMARKTLAEQKAQLENSRAAKSARMEEIQQKAADEDRTKDEAEREEFDTLDHDIESIDKELADAYRLERAQVSVARPAIGHNSQAGSEARDVGGGQHVTRMQRQLPPGIAFARFVRCIVAGGGIPVSALGIAEKQFPDMDDLHMVLRAAVAAGSTSAAGFAGNLVQYQDMSNEFIEFLRPRTVIGRIPGLRMVPFNVRIPRQTSGASAYWVGEGQPKPVTASAFDTITLRWKKLANIAVLTDEVARFTNPAIDGLVRDDLANAIVQQQNSDFLNPANAGTTDVKPASITNGVTPTVASGTTADDVRADLVALVNKFIINHQGTSGLVFVGNQTTAAVISAMFNTLGQPEFPGMTPEGGRMLGYPFIASQIQPASGSPATSIIVAMRPEDILVADDGQVQVDASREASLQMMDNPTNASTSGSPATPVPTTMVSMFQTNSVAVRAERYIDWAKARTTAVEYLSGVAYAL